jgi:hypothetical protein
LKLVNLKKVVVRNIVRVKSYFDSLPVCLCVYVRERERERERERGEKRGRERERD